MQLSAINKEKKFQVELLDKPICGGGQGNIYLISYPTEYSSYCAKIYKSSKHANENNERLKYMIENRPRHTEMQKIRICWPDYLLYDNNYAFVGYLMPLAFKNSRDLKIIETYNFNKTIAEKYPKYKNWNKFDFSDSKGFVRRLQMMKNWALAVDIIHKAGKYVLVDIKPENVLATETGLISIVDTDSIQIDDGAFVFKGPVATPEYFAKESRQLQEEGKLQTTYCDMFALGVSFYKILTGTHPYSGYKLLPPYNTDDYCNIASHIDADLFAFGKNNKYIQFVQDYNLHSRFRDLPSKIQNLFLRTFNTTTNYPSASEWVDVLNKQIHNSQTRSPRIFKGKVPIQNMESRCLCTLIFDVSGSMASSVDAMNDALSTFVENLCMGMGGFSNESKELIELCVIQFDGNASVIRKPSLVLSLSETPVLEVSNGRTNTTAALNLAIDIVEQRKSEYKKAGLSYYRPWIVLITDGNPDPYNEREISNVVIKLKYGIQNKHFIFNAIGLGKKVDKQFLKLISSDNYKRISKTNFSSMFRTLSCSLNSRSKGFETDNLLDGLGEIDL